MANYSAISVDISDCSLEGATLLLQEVLNGMTAVTTVLSVKTSYSVCDPDSSYRDFHYNDVGFIVVGIEKPKKKDAKP
jgi:hypothetical protein